MSDAVLLEEIRERRKDAENGWDDIHTEAKKDRLCLAGRPWEALDPDGLKQRKDAKRPYLAVDELGQYINQTVNGVRANPRGIKFAPTGNGANDAGAEFYQNHTREIEYRSHAQMAYSTAFENCVSSSVGWLRVRAEREHIRTFNQQLRIDPVVNADQVLSDPQGIWPDARDAKFLFYIEPWARKEAERKFGKKIKAWSKAGQRAASDWGDLNQTQIAEYWRLTPRTRTLIAFKLPGIPDLQIALEDELPDGKLPEGVENLRSEAVEDTTVEGWLTNGIDILDELKWLGKYLPFVSCLGKVMYVEGKDGRSDRQILSMTRLARDPFMLYCYIRTCQAEVIGGVPRASFIGYKGQFHNPNDWAKAAHEPVTFLEAEATVLGASPGNVLPLPQRQPWDPPIQNLEIAAEAARRAIQAAMGITPLPTPMQRDNQKSGAAMDKMDSSMQRGSFHYNDNYELMIERTGIILADAMPRYLDTARDVPIRKPDDTGDSVRINDPKPQPGQFPSAAHHTVAMQGWQQRNPRGDDITTKGDYRVTVSSGPATENQRLEASDFVQGMLANLQQIAAMAGPPKALEILAKAIKLKQLGPIGDEIVSILEPPKPPGADGKPVPPELQQAMQQAQQAAQKISELQHVIETEQVKAKQATDLKQMDITWQREKLNMESDVKVWVAELGAKVDRMALLLEEWGQVRQTIQDGHTVVQEARAKVADKIHELNVQDLAHKHATAQSSQDAAEAQLPPPIDPNAAPTDGAAA